MQSAEARARELGCPVLDFDIEQGPEFREDCFRMWDYALEKGPVFYSTAAHGFWVFSGHELIKATSMRPDLFSNKKQELWRRDEHVMPQMLPHQVDPPEHWKYRKVLAPLFTPKAVALFEDTFRTLANRFIDDIVGKREVEFMEAYALPIPAQFFLGLMGLEEEKMDEMLRCLLDATFLSNAEDPDGARRGYAGEFVCNELMRLIQVRRANPSDDLCSQIMAKQVEGRDITDDELFRIYLLLANAGVETTGGSHSYIFKYLAENPHARDWITASEQNTVNGIEELLRVFAVANSNRLVVEDVEFEGIPLRKGDRIIIARASANRDPAGCPFGKEVSFETAPNPSTVFGIGVHHCLGSHIARMELKVSIQEWHRRIPEYRVNPNIPIRHHVGTTFSLENLPLILG